MMGFRSVLTAACLCLVSFVCDAATTLTLAHIYPADHPTSRSVARFAEMVRVRTQGRVVVKVFDDATMGNQAVIVRSLKAGSLDMSVLAHGTLVSIVPEANAFGLPFLFADSAAAWRVLDGPIGRQFSRKLSERGIVLLTFWDVETRQLSNSVRPVLKPADLSGLRIRVPPDELAAEVIGTLGGKPEEINFSDLYKALQRGVVDGQENALVNYRTLKLYEVQKYLSLTGHKQSVFSMLVTRAAWDALSAGDREIVGKTAVEAARHHRKLTGDAEEEIRRGLAARGVRVDAVDKGPFIAATAGIYERWYASPIGEFVRAVVSEARGQP